MAGEEPGVSPFVSAQTDNIVWWKCATLRSKGDLENDMPTTTYTGSPMLRSLLVGTLAALGLVWSAAAGGMRAFRSRTQVEIRLDLQRLAHRAQTRFRHAQTVEALLTDLFDRQAVRLRAPEDTPGRQTVPPVPLGAYLGAFTATNQYAQALRVQTSPRP